MCDQRETAPPGGYAAGIMADRAVAGQRCNDWRPGNLVLT